MTTRKYSLVIEGDPSGCSAYVPELPSILVTGRSVEELAARPYPRSKRTDSMDRGVAEWVLA